MSIEDFGIFSPKSHTAGRKKIGKVEKITLERRFQCFFIIWWKIGGFGGIMVATVH
ncbi:MAG: hypothetical protein II114_06905 [Treponema sp.]|nr:hypothetical protein [Treponema sp.]